MKAYKLAVSILLAGFLAGFLDGMAAVADVYLITGRGPDVVFKYIASGVFGNAAFSGGTPMVLAGILFHFFIATMWAFLFFVSFPLFSVLQKNRYVVGVAYGVLIWLTMTFVVVPLSDVSQRPSGNIFQTLKAMSYVVLFVGIPISLLAKRYYSNAS